METRNFKERGVEPLTFGSLFAGIGGFDLGFERAGMQCKWQVEIDDYATRVLEKHWPSVHRERDIRDCGKHNLEAVDVICGGFPCQDISVANVTGKGLDGERSGLFFEAVRVIDEVQPRIAVLENVSAILSDGMGRVLGEMAAIGYDTEWHCIPAASVGATHIRDRVFFLAYAGRERRKGSVAIKRAPVCKKAPQPIVDDEASGSRSLMDRNIWTVRDSEVSLGVERHRLRGLGNAVVPQVAEWIGRRIIESEKQCPSIT